MFFDLKPGEIVIEQRLKEPFGDAESTGLVTDTIMGSGGTLSHP